MQSIAYKYFYSFNPLKTFSIISKKDISELRQLSRNQEIVVCKPDKGKGVVILDESTYIEKMMDIISDHSKFEVLSETIEKYTTKIENKVNNFLYKIKNAWTIPLDTLSSLHVSGSVPGILYGLPKTHKPDFSTNFKFRPIFAAYSNPCYKVAKFLVNALASYTTNQYSVSNVYSFLSDLDSVDGNNYYMCSFDVENLFTNIP